MGNMFETAKRVCDFLNAHEIPICITTFGKYIVVMKKIMIVIKEAHAVEREMRQTARKRFCEETTARTQRAKALKAAVKRGGMSMVAIERKLDEIF